MADLLIDTDIFVDHLRSFRRLDPGKHAGAYSVITRSELFAGTSVDEREVGQLLGIFREFPVDRGTAEAAGRIRREHGLRTPDALIAATAIEHGHALFTRNLKDFSKVKGLRLREP